MRRLVSPEAHKGPQHMFANEAQLHMPKTESIAWKSSGTEGLVAHMVMRPILFEIMKFTIEPGRQLHIPHV